MSEFQVTQTGSRAEIALGQKLVAAEVPDLKDHLKLLISSGVTSIQLDCARLEQIDSTGIGCLVATHNSLAKVAGSLSIAQVSPDIFDLLCSMRLDRHIKIVPQVKAQE